MKIAELDRIERDMIIPTRTQFHSARPELKTSIVLQNVLADFGMAPRIYGLYDASFLLAKLPEFQKCGVSRLRKHVTVVVTFKYERVAALQMRQNMRRGVSQISQDTELARPIGTGELQRLPGVVRHREWHKLHLRQVNRYAVAGYAEQAVKVR